MVEPDPAARRVLRVIGAEPELVGSTPYWNATLVEFDGQVLIVSHRAILTLVTIAGCNAACSFCSNEITFTSKGPYLAHDERLARTIALARLVGIRKVAFTGGEPTVNPRRLLALLGAVAPDFERVRLHTNGIGLLRDVHTGDGTAPLIDALVDAGLTGASVSVAHGDPATNRRLMRFKTSWDGLDEPSLREIAARGSEGRFWPRLSCVLTPEGVRDVDDVLRYVEWGRELGFSRFIFRSPSAIPAEFSKRNEFTAYNAGAASDIHALTDVLANRPGWEETFTQHKSDSHVHVFRVDGSVTVDVDQSGEEPDPDDKIRRLTVMANGVTYRSWIDPYAIVFPDDRDRAVRSAAMELPDLQRQRI